MLQRVWRCVIGCQKGSRIRGIRPSDFNTQVADSRVSEVTIMARQGTRCEVLTLWENQAAIDKLAHSTSYQTTVGRIRAADFVVEELGTTIMPVHEAELCDYRD